MTETWTLARCDAEPSDENPVRWQIGFDVTDDAGRSVHTVTTIYSVDLPQNTREQAIATAKRELKRQRESSVAEPQGEPSMPWPPPDIEDNP